MLIKLDRMADAKAVFEQAKSKGAKGDGFDRLEERLSLSQQTASVESSNVQNPPKDQLQVLINLYTQGQYQEALDGASKLLKEFPNSVILYNIIGVVNQGLGKLEEAVKAYKRAINIKPNYAEAYNNLGNAFERKASFDKALQAYNKSISLNPNNAQFYTNKGNALHDQGNLEEAIDAFDTALSIKPQYAEAINNKGNALKDQGNLEEAIVAFNTALSIKPDFAEAHSNKGNALKDKGNLEEAIEAYKAAIIIKPNFAGAHNNLGNVLKDQGKLEKAVDAFKVALSIKPNYPEAHNNSGNVLKSQGKLEEAVQAYKKALSIKSNYADAYNNRVMLCETRASWRRRQRLLKLHFPLSRVMDAYNNLGNTLREQGKLEEAVRALKKHFLLALVWLRPTLTWVMFYKIRANWEKQLRLTTRPFRLNLIMEAWNNIFFSLRALRAGGATDEELSTFYPRSDASDYAKIALSILDYKLHRGHRAVGSYFDQALTLLARADNITIPHPTFDKSSNNQMPAMPDKMVALVHFGRSGTGLLHSLIDGHPSISTLPSIYFSEYFDHFTWERIIAGGREEMVDRFISIYEVLFDASSVVPIETKGKALKYKIGIEEGMANVGDKGDEVLTVDKEVFRSELNCLIDYHEQMDASIFFRLVHVAFDKAINDQNHKRLIFYHIHNPDTSAKLNFVRSTPHSNWIVMVREPVQSCESWLRKSLEKNSYTEIANKILNMLFEIDDIVYKRQRSVGVRLEDLKRRPRETIPALCNWMGIEENEQLYQMTAQGKKWWGDPSSPDYSNDGMDPFGKTSIDRKVGSIFSKNDQFILRTLFYPFSVRFGYIEENEEQFRNDLREIRPKIDEMFDFEKRIAEKTMINFEQFTCSGSYLYLRSGLIERWNTLNEFNTYPDMIEPLKI